MKILFVTARENNPHIGGIERVTYTLSREFLDNEMEVFWVAASASGINSGTENICQQHFLPNPEIDSEINRNWCIRFILDNGVDIIINQATINTDICRLCHHVKSVTGRKLISVFHFAPRTEYDIARNNVFLLRGKKLSSVFFSKIKECLYFIVFNRNRLLRKEESDIKLICDNSDKVILLSKNFIQGFNALHPSDKYSAISNPLDICAKIAPTEKKKQILYVARLEYGMKRFDRMLKIWERLYRDFPDWSLTVIGGGDYLPHFQNKAAEMGLVNISFKGFADPEPYFKESSVICLTSTCEGFGMVLVEAMQYGCVPVAFDSYASLSDIIEDGVNGYKVKPFSIKSFSRQLGKLMKDEALRNRMTAACNPSIRKFDSKAIAGEWISLFKSLT